jgi:hypothetical protein
MSLDDTVVEQPPIRRCGECSLCCTTHAVQKIAKRAGVPCSNLDTIAGCVLYATRPNACRNYHCAWLEGKIPLAWFPKDVGLVIDIERRSLYEYGVVTIWKCTAVDWSPKIKDLIQEMCTLYPDAILVVQTRETKIVERHFYFPAGVPQAIREDITQVYAV